MDKNLAMVSKYRCILTHTHCLGSTSWQCHQTAPTVSPLSLSQSIFLQSGDTPDTLASECPARRTHRTPCWMLSFPLLSGFVPTATYPPPPIHTQLGFIPSFSSRLQSQSSQGLSSMSGTCQSILNWPSPSASRLEENCPCSQTFSTHQGGHLRGI